MSKSLIRAYLRHLLRADPTRNDRFEFYVSSSHSKFFKSACCLGGFIFELPSSNVLFLFIPHGFPAYPKYALLMGIGSIITTVPFMVTILGYDHLHSTLKKFKKRISMLSHIEVMSKNN